jgi:hypothetical protein
VNDIGRCFLLFMFLIIFFHYHLPPADSTCWLKFACVHAKCMYLILNV